MQSSQMIRDRLRSELDKHGLTAVQLARNAGVKTSFIYDILNGKSTNPSTVKLAMVAESLGINLSYLAGATENPQSLSVPAAAGDMVAIAHLSPAANDEGHSAEPYYYFKRSWLQERLNATPDSLRAITLNGDSMEPTLCDRDLVLVDTRRTTPSPAGIFVLSDGFGLGAKRLELSGSAKPSIVRVISDNTQYGTYERPLSQLQIIGKVVWLARQL